MKTLILLPLCLTVLSTGGFGAVSINADKPDQFSLGGELARQSANPGAVLGNDMRSAFALFNAGRFAEAVMIAQDFAAKDDPEALYLLGLAHEAGNGVEASRDKALEYYRKAEKLKHQAARYRIPMVLLGGGDESERKQARGLLEAAAKEDPGMAGRIMGEVCLRGMFDGKPDVDQAIEWWQRAAAAGDQPAMMLLAELYEGQYGFEQKKDLKEAIRMYGKAAVLGHPRALVILGSRLLNGDPSIRDEPRGLEWLANAANKGVAGAHLVLGDRMETKFEDRHGALNHYESGAELGDPECMVRAARLYLTGDNPASYEKRAEILLQRAAQAGNIEANYLFGLRKLGGEKPDPGAAYNHLMVAANANLPDAQNELALAYLSGRFGVADATAAVAWFTRAARAGHALAQFNLGALYQTGSAGVPVNLQNASELYELAARQGRADAALALARLLSAPDAQGKAHDLPRAWAWVSMIGGERPPEVAQFVASLESRLGPDGLAKARDVLQQLKNPAPAKAGP